MIYTIASFRSPDGRQFTIEGLTIMKLVQLFVDYEDNNLLVHENIFGDMYLLNAKTLGWSQIGRLPKCRWYYDRKKNHFIQTGNRIVHIWTFSQN